MNDIIPLKVLRWDVRAQVLSMSVPGETLLARSV
jgi:hypothetical protein